MNFKGVIFDLDGTLVNTLADIAGSMNRALEGRGYPRLDPEAYRNIVGWGIKALALKAMPRGDEKAAELLAADAARFYEEAPLGHSKPYPGIPGLVRTLREKKLKTAVLSNKPDPVARLVIQGLFPPDSFDLVRGDIPGMPRKPDPAALWDILVGLDLCPRDTIFVGDSEIDMETALAAGCHALGVSWGFRSRKTLVKAGAQRIIDTPAELLDFIDPPGEPNPRLRLERFPNPGA
jgi:phosphoglycolate phosphatase